MAEIKDIVKLAVDGYKGKVEKIFRRSVSGAA